MGVSDFDSDLGSWLFNPPRPFNHTKGERRLYPVPECREDAGSNEPCLKARYPALSSAYCRKPAITEHDDSVTGPSCSHLPLIQRIRPVWLFGIHYIRNASCFSNRCCSQMLWHLCFQGPALKTTLSSIFIPELSVACIAFLTSVFSV